MNTFALTLWRTFSRGRRTSHTWRTFIDTFVADPEIVRDKESVAGFSLGAFEENRRSLPRVEHVHALTLDFDCGDTTLKQAAGLFPGVQGVTYTTFNHSAKHPKLRLILPLSRNVDADEYARIWDWAEKKLTAAGHMLDEAARDASRFWYLPSHRPRAAYAWQELVGAPLDVEGTLKNAPTSTRPLPVNGGQDRAPTNGRGRATMGDGSASETFFGRAFTLAEMAFDSLENGALSVLCPWAHEHTSGSDGDSSTVIFPATTDSQWGLFHCSHSHCARRTTSDLLDVLPVRALEAARREHGRGLLRVRVIDGWAQRLDAISDFPEIDRFILKCRPGEGPVFTMTVKEGSSMHLQYLDGLPLLRLIGRRLDVSLVGRDVKAARLVGQHGCFMPAKTIAVEASRILAAYEPGASIATPDFDLLFALMCRHPRASEIIGAGVRRIRVQNGGRTRRFEVARIDGSSVVFGALS